MTKSHINHYCQSVLEERIAAFNAEMKALQADANSDTKSSAGDKFETARSMAQLEIEKLRQRKNQALDDLALLIKLQNELQPREFIGPGALVQTDNGLFYISAGLGKLAVESIYFFAVSAISPVAKALMGKKPGDLVTINQNNYTILKIQ
jgi:hypothetical protein